MGGSMRDPARACRASPSPSPSSSPSPCRRTRVIAHHGIDLHGVAPGIATATFGGETATASAATAAAHARAHARTAAQPPASVGRAHPSAVRAVGTAIGGDEAAHEAAMARGAQARPAAAPAGVSSRACARARARELRDGRRSCREPYRPAVGGSTMRAIDGMPLGWRRPPASCGVIQKERLRIVRHFAATRPLFFTTRPTAFSSSTRPSRGGH